MNNHALIEQIVVAPKRKAKAADRERVGSN
jgi:hypothetical protein